MDQDGYDKKETVDWYQWAITVVDSLSHSIENNKDGITSHDASFLVIE